MSDHKMTMAQMAVMQSMRASTRLAHSTWRERYGAQVGLAVMFGVLALALMVTLVFRFME